MNPSPDTADHPARILIVDDERHNRRLLEVMLTPGGFLLLTAASGEEALAIVAQQPPDIILLDVMMPGMDGYQVASRIKGNLATKNIPIIMVTALDDRNARMLGLSAGAEDFVTKPVDRAELGVRVRNLLRLKAYGDYYDKYSHRLEGEVGSRTADLVESERLYRSTFDAAPVGIVHVGLDGQWLRVNQRLCELLGYSREELQSSAVQELLQSEEVAGEAESFRQMAGGTLDRHVVDEKRYRRRDGSVVWARVNISVHRDANGHSQHFISVIEDITQRRTLEAQVRQAGKMDAIGRLASGVAHDFNNVLTVILGFCDLLLADFDPADPRQADISEIQKAGASAAGLTRQLLAFSRKEIIEPMLLDLNVVVADMRAMLGRLIREDVKVVLGLGPGLAPVKADRGQMEQIVLNLAVNAHDAMPGGGTLTIETANVELDEHHPKTDFAVEPGPYVMLTVTDTGAGMSPQVLARLFEPFFTTKALDKGTGLGLATVHGIVMRSGGSVTVDSEVGRGTSFKVYFPRADAAGVVVSAPPPVARPRAEAQTVLVVEDAEGLRELARRLLQRQGYTVLVAANADDALRLIERHASIDVLLTDVVMPGASGPELTRQLIERQPGLKVIYMSGYSEDTIVQHGVLNPGIAFLHKPFTSETLGRKIREVLDR